VSEMKKEVRGGKSSSTGARTTSTRRQYRCTRCGSERPTVSTPVTWEEVEEAWTKKKVEKLVFEAGQVLSGATIWETYLRRS